MVYYADYEALEFDNKKAIEKNIYPYYLNNTVTDKSLCPVFFSACNKHGKVMNKQNAFKRKISFVDFLDKEVYRFRNVERKVLFVWFHNVQYDFSIIKHELFFNNFINILDSETIEYIGEYQTQQDKSFAIVGENLSKFIGINIYYKGFKILVRDTMSILNTGQDNILRDFGYQLKTPIIWENITIDNLLSYMPIIEERNVYDVTSLSKCLEEFKELFSIKFKGKGTTSASMSLDSLKTYLCENVTLVEPTYDNKNETFKLLYPPLTGLSAEISAGCYSGGISTINKKHASKILTKIQMVDINSSYPYSMTQPLPYGKGKPIYEFTKEGYSEYVIYVDFKFNNTIPFQRCHSENRARSLMGLDKKEVTFSKSQFPSEFKGYLCLNSIDVDTLKRHATIKKLEFKQGINYKTNTSIKDFIVPIYNERKQSTGVTKTAIKLLLNSLYGKFAQDLSGIVFVYENVKDYNKVIAIDNDTLFKPLASAVTAYARKNWIDTVYLLGDNFIYGDTDSIYYLNYEKIDKILKKKGLIHDNELGKWAYENDYLPYIDKGIFLSKKNYLLDVKGELSLTCVGLSKRYHDQINFDNFKLNSIPFKVQKMVNVYGGKAMRETEFKIRDRKI